MAKLAYNQLLQCMFVVVDEGLLLACHHYSCQLQSLYDPTPPPGSPPERSSSESLGRLKSLISKM
jgi:hypothetical protein